MRSVACSRSSLGTMWRAGLAVVLAATAAGCANGPRVYPITGVADPVINRDVNGDSLSIVIYAYQLRDKAEFARLTFDALASGKGDAELFPQELLGRSELMLVPGGQQIITGKLLPEARYVGVVGLFRKPDGQRWRFLVDADAVRRKGLAFEVKDCYLKPIEPEPLPMPGQSAGYRPECGLAAPYAVSKE